MNEKVINVVVKSDKPLPEEVILKLRSYKYLSVTFTTENMDCGYPFKGYPNKYKKETWAQWEEKCKRLGYDTNKITAEMVVKEHLKYLRHKHHREQQDVYAHGSESGVTVTPNCHTVGLD